LNGPDTLVDLLQSDGVLFEGVGDKEQALFELKGACVGEALDDEMARVLDRGQSPRVLPVGRAERDAGVLPLRA